MTSKKLRIGLIGAGANTRLRHIPGLLALPEVELLAVCNRRPDSTRAVAQEFGIPRTYNHWQDLVADPDLDAIVVGTWPYLHCPVTVAALSQGKHVLTEARMSLNAEEAHQMLAAAQARPDLIAQIVPSPYGLRGHRIMQDAIRGGFLGELREVHVQSLSGQLAEVAAPLSWRQDAALSGYNMLNLGIIHETLLRWAPPPIRVLAQVHAFVPSRIDPASGVRRMVGTPDSVQVLAVLEGGARAVYQLSGVTCYGQGASIRLYGTEGVLIYDLTNDRIYGTNRQVGGGNEPVELPIPEQKAQGWRVEADFVGAIREQTPVVLTDFETGVAYMEFTEAVARSAEQGMAITLPLEDYRRSNKSDG